MAIPNTLHYIWVGPNPLPPEAQAAIAHWQKVMPDFAIRQWDEGTIDFSSHFIRGAYATRGFNRTANYARLLALYEHGGIYFDHDVEVIRDFTPLLGNSCFFGFQTLDPTERDLLNNAVIGAEPRHPFIGKLLAEMDKLDGREEVGSATGPGLVSKLLREAGLAGPSADIAVVDGVTLYPPAYFYPYHWKEDFDPACIGQETYAVHHWAHTWKRKPSLKSRVVKKLIYSLAKASAGLGYFLQRGYNRLCRSLRQQRR